MPFLPRLITFCKWFQFNNPVLLGLFFAVGQLLKVFMGHCLTSKAMAPVSEQLLPNVTQQSTQNFKLLDKYAQLTPSQDFLLMVVKKSVMVKKIMVVIAFYMLGSIKIRKLVKNGIGTLTFISPRGLVLCCHRS